MDPILTPMLVGTGINLVGGILGNNAASGDRAEASRILKDLYDKYNALDIPDVEKLKLALEEYQSAGAYVPEQEALLAQLSDTNLAGISTDPRLAQTQADMLAKTEQLAETGMSAIDRAQLDQLLRSTNANTTANQKSILENRARRGMASGGDELAAELSAGQSGANRASAEALQIAAEAMNRRMAATGQAAALAKSIEDSQYGRQSDVASARDAIERFNKSMSQDVASRNTQTRNQAQQTNLQNEQARINANTGLRNQQQQYNKNLYQQDFENNLRKLQGMSGAGTAQSKNLDARADATSNMYSNVASGLGSISANLLKAQSNTNNTSVNPVDRSWEDTDQELTTQNRNKNLNPFGG